MVMATPSLTSVNTPVSFLSKRTMPLMGKVSTCVVAVVMLADDSMEWIVSLANLTEDDKRLFRLLFIKRKKVNDILYDMGWGSNHTFYRHKKIVLAEFKRVLRRLFF